MMNNSTDTPRRNHPYELVSAKKNLDVTDQPISPNVSSFPSGRRLIDAQTYVDAQSNGLTNRIVRYDEENKNKPKIYNRLYKRPGDFPIVHLDKPKLILSPTRSIANPPKIARIGQPDPSNYRTDIRAEILRNGTLMPQLSVDRQEDVSGALVRVDPLDALKEISRKRIHCEDAIPQLQSVPFEKDATDSIPSAANSSKRQRIGSTLYSLSTNDSASKGTNASKCNEILSSLSSSSYMMPSQNLKRAKSSSPTNAISQAKRIQSEKPDEIPTVDLTIDAAAKVVEENVPKVVEKNHPIEPARPKLTLFNRPYESNRRNVPSVSNDPNDELGISFVKPRAMTARSKECVDNWLKIKPDENKRLALMLSCLSGDVDYCDAVDSSDKVKEPPAFKTADETNDNSSKEKSTTNSGISSTVVSTSAQVTIPSTTTSSVPAIPTVTFNPIAAVITTSSVSLTASTTSTTTQAVLPTTTTVQAVPAIEERKGGFSFPLVPKDSPKSTAIPTVVSSAPSAPAVSSVTPTSVTAVASAVISKESTPTTTPAVSFTFNPPKSTVSSSVAPPAEPTFSFGNAATTKPSAALPAFAFSTAAKTTIPTTTSTENNKLGDPKNSDNTSKPVSFAAFGQTVPIGTVGFGNGAAASTLPTTTSTASIFGNVTSSFSSTQPPTLASVPTIQPAMGTNKPVQANLTTSVFGSVLSNNSTSNAAKQVDPRPSTGGSLLSNQIVNPITTSSIGSSAPFAFGNSTTASSAFTNTQTTLPSTFGAIKPTNSSANIFGSATTQQPTTATTIFGSSVKSTAQTPTESDRNVSSQNIFGSSAAKSTPSFTFSANNQSKPNIFGGQTSTGSANLNAFGSSINNFVGSEQKANGANKSFTFGGNNSETSKQITFGTNTSNDSTKSIGFAANNPTNTPNLFNTKPTNEVPKVFSFGGNTNATTVATTNATFGGTGIPSFGNTFGNANATPAFGNPTPSFGTTNATPIFGSANAPSAFGGSSATSPPAFVNSTTSPPVFGSNNSTTSAFGSSNSATSTLTFGSINTTTAPLVFGSTNATPSFGSASFGGTNAIPAFGASNATPNFGGTSVTPTFGGTNATPTFGGTNATPTFGTTNATPAFGTTNATPTFGTTNATPTFGATTTSTFGGTTTPTFGATTIPSFGGTATPTFGGTTTSTFGATNATSSFGANNTTPGFGGTSVNPTFGAGSSFGSSIGAPAFGSSLNSTAFGGNTAAPSFTTSTGTSDINKTFNFTGSDPPPSPLPNLFNIGPTNSSPRGRTIRTATRRTYR